MTQLEQIREKERLSHIDAYTQHTLYQAGSWLKKPVQTVMDLLENFDSYPSLRILDLGCGVGRNCIAIAQHFSNIHCEIDCVDILDLAIEKLKHNAEKYNVLSSIHGCVMPLERYSIPTNAYDLILAVSALEHVDSEGSFVRVLAEIKSGIRENGVFCLIINTDVQEFDKFTGQPLSAQFEVNLTERKLRCLLQDIFSGWSVLKYTVQQQNYDIPRDDIVACLYSYVVTFVVKKL